MCHIVPMILLDVQTGRGGYLSHYSDIFHIYINLLHSAGVLGGLGWRAGLSGRGWKEIVEGGREMIVYSTVVYSAVQWCTVLYSGLVQTNNNTSTTPCSARHTLSSSTPGTPPGSSYCPQVPGLRRRNIFIFCLLDWLVWPDLQCINRVVCARIGESRQRRTG